jgi:MFS-type transporter involved in bile tolerance (Atg22 family)
MFVPKIDSPSIIPNLPSLTHMLAVLAPFQDLSKRRSMAALLISFTIYTDTTYAISSVTSQLFVAEVRPDSLEYSLYALAQTICGVVCTVAFLWVRPLVRIRLESWLLISYGILMIIPIWGCIGFAGVNFGYKVSLTLEKTWVSRVALLLIRMQCQMRWEFYIQVFLITLSGNVSNITFRVLFSEMMPPRNEVRWFGLQYVLSCATVSTVPQLAAAAPLCAPSRTDPSMGRSGSTTSPALRFKTLLTSCASLWSSV